VSCRGIIGMGEPRIYDATAVKLRIAIWDKGGRAVTNSHLLPNKIRECGNWVVIMLCQIVRCIYMHSLQPSLPTSFFLLFVPCDLWSSENCPLLDVLTSRGLPFVAHVYANFLLKLKNTRIDLLLSMQKAPPPLQKLKGLYFIA
jgi:hypothetical protein